MMRNIIGELGERDGIEGRPFFFRNDREDMREAGAGPHQNELPAGPPRRKRNGMKAFSGRSA